MTGSRTSRSSTSTSTTAAGSSSWTSGSGGALLEHTLLYLFLANPGQTLTREDILKNIWGDQSAVTSNVIDRHIRDLRVKLQERWREPRFIETVPGAGYRFLGAEASAT